MRCDVMRRMRRTSFPFSSLLCSSSSFRVLLSLDHFIYTLSIFTSFTTISLHLLLPPRRPPQNANPCSQVPLPSFPTLARHETHYRSTLQPPACAIAWSTITHILADLSSKRDEHQSTEAIHAIPYTSPLHALLQHVQPHNRLLPKVQGF
jgi:hypothetical protein